MQNETVVYVIRGKKNLTKRELHHVYDLSFKTWLDTWEKTYQQDFLSKENLPSDEFTRQDEVLSIFHKGECVALCFFSHVKITDESARLDSYFKHWLKNGAIEGLCAHGPNVIICSQFTVGEKFRKTGPLELQGVPWKALLMGLLCKYYLHSGKDGMTGTMRVSKSMEKLTYIFGAIPLVEKHVYKEATEQLPVDLVDLVAFFQDNVKRAYYALPYASYLDDLWEKRNPGRLAIVA